MLKHLLRMGCIFKKQDVCSVTEFLFLGLLLSKKIFFNLIFSLYFYLFIYLFLAALGLHCCAQAFSSCSEQGLLFVAVCRLLIAVASLVAEHGL